MKTIKKWLCEWLGIKRFELKVNKFIDDNNGQILDRFGLLEDKIRKIQENVDKLEEWCHHTAECHTSNMDRLDEDIQLLQHNFNKLNKLMDSNLGETIDKLIDDLHLLKSRQKCDYNDLKDNIVCLDDVIREHKSKQKFDLASLLDELVSKDIKDNERRIDRLEQCIYGLSISDDVKATDVKAYVKDMAHQMYGERAARGDDSADYDEVPF